MTPVIRMSLSASGPWTETGNLFEAKAGDTVYFQLFDTDTSTEITTGTFSWTITASPSDLRYTQQKLPSSTYKITWVSGDVIDDTSSPQLSPTLTGKYLVRLDYTSLATASSPAAVYSISAGFAVPYKHSGAIEMGKGELLEFDSAGGWAYENMFTLYRTQLHIGKMEGFYFAKQYDVPDTGNLYFYRVTEFGRAIKNFPGASINYNPMWYTVGLGRFDPILGIGDETAFLGLPIFHTEHERTGGKPNTNTGATSDNSISNPPSSDEITTAYALTKGVLAFPSPASGGSLDDFIVGWADNPSAASGTPIYVEEGGGGRLTLTPPGNVIEVGKILDSSERVVFIDLTSVIFLYKIGIFTPGENDGYGYGGDGYGT